MSGWFRVRFCISLVLGLTMVAAGMFVGCGDIKQAWQTPDNISNTDKNKNHSPLDRFGVSHQNIINGAEDTSLPAVGALVIDSFPFCTATLISKKVLVTAAHCIEAVESYGKERVQFRVDVPQSDGLLKSEFFDIDKTFMHSKYNADRTTDFSDYDIGVLVLKKIVRNIQVVEPYLEPIPSSWKGKKVKVMGYGVTQTYPAELESEEKRSIEIPLFKLDSRALVHFDEATKPEERKSACHGDSGGPVLFKVSGKWRIIAVNSAAFQATPSSTGGTYCDGGTASTRLDANYKDFLSAILTSYGDAALPCQGNQCGDCETCQNNVCAPKTISQESYRCKACRLDSDCGTGLCARFGDTYRCVQPCDGKGCCPRAHDCQISTGLSGKKQSVCLPKDPCPKATCKADNDCSSSEICDKGTCALKPPGINTMICRRCAKSPDCGKDNYCVNAKSGLGYCVQSCWKGDTCPDGFKCKEVMPGIKQCMPQGICRAICDSSNPCPTGYQCQGGKCYHPKDGQVGDFCDGKNQCDGRFDIKTIKGHTGTVYGMAYSPDGKYLATSSSDKTVKLWEVSTNKLLFTLTDHQGAVFAVAFSVDGKTLATGSSDRTIKLWNVADGKLKQTLTQHTGAIRSLSFNAKYLASGSTDRTIKLWEEKTQWTLVSTLTGHTGTVYSVAFRGGARLASGSEDKTIKIWRVPRTLEKTITGHNGTIRSLAFNDTELLLVSSSDDKTVRAWKMPGGKPYKRVLEGFAGAVNSVRFSPDNENIVAGSADHTIRMWRGYDSALLRVMKNQNVAIHSMAISPVSNTMAVGLANGNIVIRGCFDCGLECVVTDQKNFYKRCLQACKPPPQAPGKLGGPCINEVKCDSGLICFTSLVGKRICVEGCQGGVKTPGLPPPPGTSKCKWGGACLDIYDKNKPQCRCYSNDDCPQGKICSTSQLGKKRGTGICQPAPTCPGGMVCKSVYQKPYGQYCVPSSPEQPPGAICSLIGKCENSLSTCLDVRRGQSLSICGESCNKSKGKCTFGGTCGSGDIVCHCTQDSDCPKNRKCRPVSTDSKGQTKGVCAVPEGGPCVDQKDCVSEYYCFHGKCHFGPIPPPEPGPEPPGPEPKPEMAPEPIPEPDASVGPEPPGPEPPGPEPKPGPEPAPTVDKVSGNDNTPDSQQGGGCSCSTTSPGTPTNMLWMIVLLGALFRRKDKASLK